MSLLRRPNADLCIVAANSAATLAYVVRQFMTRALSLPRRSATSGNADIGGGQSVSSGAIFLTHGPWFLLMTSRAPSIAGRRAASFDRVPHHPRSGSPNGRQTPSIDPWDVETIPITVPA